MGGFSLAYEHVLFPARDPNDILILFNLVGVTDGYLNAHVDVAFSATNRTEETVQIVLTRDELTNALNITAVGLVSRLDSKGPVYMFGEEFNRRLDLIASQSNMTTFIPREWDECGRKDDFVRQCFCNVGYWWSDNWLLVAIIVGSVIGGIPVLAGFLYLIWLLRKAQIKSAEYGETLPRSEDESERLIRPGDLRDDEQEYMQEKTRGASEGDMVVTVNGEPNIGGPGFLPKPSANLGTSKPLPQVPLEWDPVLEQHMPGQDGSNPSSTEENSNCEDSQFGQFVHNVGDSE